EAVMRGRRAGGQGGGRQQGTLGCTGRSRRDSHQGHVVVDGFPDAQAVKQIARCLTLVRAQRNQSGVTAVQHPLQGRQQHRYSAARRNAQGTQNCYACSPASGVSSSGQPCAANRVRTRSTSSGDGSSSVSRVISTPMSASSNSPRCDNSWATALTCSLDNRRVNRASTANVSVGGMPSGYPARSHETIEPRNPFTLLSLREGV